MSEYLGVPEGMFNCILPDHDDNTPSAHIYSPGNGVQLYKCFGCNQVRTIITVTEQLAQCTRKQAIEFIKAVYQLEYKESDWVKTQREEIDTSIEYLQSESFRMAYPNINHILGCRKKDLLCILSYVKPWINEEMQFNGKPIFSLDLKRLMHICETSNRKRIISSMNMFALLGMIDKLSLSSIPDYQLKKAKALQD